MTLEEYRDKYHAAAALVGSPDRLEEAAADGNADDPVIKMRINDHVSLLVSTPDDVTRVVVVAQMTQLGVSYGVLTYAIALDALGIGNINWRDGLLRRMHLTDGKYQGGDVQTQARGWIFALSPQCPASNLMTLIIAKE